MSSTERRDDDPAAKRKRGESDDPAPDDTPSSAIDLEALVREGRRIHEAEAAAAEKRQRRLADEQAEKAARYRAESAKHHAESVRAGDQRLAEARAKAEAAAKPDTSTTAKRRTPGAKRKRKRKQNTSPKPAKALTFETATTPDELVQAAAADCGCTLPVPTTWRKLSRWLIGALHQSYGKDLSRAVTENLRAALDDDEAWWIVVDQPKPEEVRIIGDSRVFTIMEYNQLWLELSEPRPRHLVSFLIDAWFKDQPIDRDHRGPGILPGSWRDARHYDHLPLKSHPYPGPPGSMDGDQHLLPLAELQSFSVIVPVLPLALYDSGTGPMATRGRGAPYAQRLFVEILLDVGRLDRVPGQTARVEVTLRELVTWLWPNGWKRSRRGDRLGDLQILQRELLILDSMRILWERMLWRMVAVQALPTETSRMEDVIVFRVEHLPGSEHGPMIDRDRLRSFGTVSAPAWRAFLRLAYLWDAAKRRNNGARIYATRPVVARGPRGVLMGTDGKVLRDRRGAVVKDWSDPRAVILGANGRPASDSNPPAYERNPAADRVPMLGPDDLIRLAFDDNLDVPAATRRWRLHEARKVAGMFAEAGVAMVEQDGAGLRLIEQRR